MSYTRGLSAQPSDLAYDLAVYIGRFQPFHHGHMNVVRQALEKADHVLILIGSANRARDTRNPFTFEERREVILANLAPEQGDRSARVTILPLNDFGDKVSWVNEVSTIARSSTRALRPRVCLTGHIRDTSSEYLTWFPAWDYLPAKDTSHNSTAIRAAFFAGAVDFHKRAWKDKGLHWPSEISAPTIDFLDRFRGSPHYAYLMNQRAAEIAYKEKWGSGPFQTVDPVIVKGDHVLMIERGGEEGTGSIGLPGGFLNTFERLFDGAAREGIEETGLFLSDIYHRRPDTVSAHGLAREPAAGRNRAVSSAIKPPEEEIEKACITLKGYARGRGERFDDPYRSRRGRLITEAFLFVLPDGHGLPQVTGMDDAKRAFWMPISGLRPDNSFEDHAFIVDKMLCLHG